MSPKTATIVLLGESGVGKTTLINMIGQYFANATLDDAKRRGLQIYAPCSFSIIDSNNVSHHIQVGSSPNEITISGASSTRRPQTYTFNVPSQNMVLNIVDTPGLASTGGVEQDNKNLQETLKYLGEYKQLDAICILLKPTNPRCNVVFQHVIRHIAKYLQPAIFHNIMFVFTNTRGYSFKPGNTYEALKKALQEIRMPVGLTLTKNNTYCIDNEAFRYLAALQNGVIFPDEDVNVYSNSFNQSRAGINRMLEYINNHLSPVLMQGAVSINESQRIVLRLSKPLLQLVINREKEIVRIQNYEKELKLKESDVDYLKGNLFKVDHKQIIKETRVHTDNTELSGTAKAKAVFLPFCGYGSAKLDYSYNSANKTTYSIDYVEERVLDRDVIDMINDSQDARYAVAENIQASEQFCQESEDEINIAINAIASFYKYLQENNNLSDDDPFLAAIESEMNIAKVDNNNVLATEIEKLLQKYQLRKAGLRSVQPQEIFELMNQLFALKHSGRSFRELMNMEFEFNSIQYSIQ